MPNVEVKLVAVPEMGYVDPNRDGGEIVVRGAPVAKGYYKEAQKTAEDFRDGWFYTGDIGRWEPHGQLKVIDRKKNMFKYVATAACALAALFYLCLGFVSIISD